jgi:hypothetical protein
MRHTCGRMMSITRDSKHRHGPLLTVSRDGRQALLRQFA